jgi:molybdenum cofactor cytidylyltransferase
VSARRELVGVIPAAGFSSRMGELKPLLPLDGVPVVVRCARAFTDVGARTLVVLGFGGDQVATALDEAGIAHVENPKFESGMFSSIQTGLRAAAGADLVAVLPADTPLVRAETVGRLARAACERGCNVVYPVHDGRRGHPPLLAPLAREAVLDGTPAGGLREVLESFEETALDVPVDDPGTLLDMDVPDDFARVAEQAERERVPGRDECLELFEEWEVADRVKAHALAVARVAADLGAALNEAGAYLNLGLLDAAALLHDVRRQSPGHAAAGSALLRSSGMPRVAAVVARHMEPPRDLSQIPDESALLYLSDKLVQEDEVVPLESRLTAALERFAGDDHACAAARRRLEGAMRIAAVVASETGCSVDQLLRREESG